MRDAQSNFQNIIVIDFGQMGDVVLSLPAIRAIREKFPDSHITALTGKVPGEVVTLAGIADEVLTVDRVELRDGAKLRSIGKILRFAGDIRRRRIDLMIDLHSLPETNILAFLSKANKRLLANRESRSLDILSNFRPKPPKEDKSKHLTDRYLDVLRPLGITDAKREFRLYAAQRDIEYVDKKFFFGAHSRGFIGLFPGAGHPDRCWRLNNFAALAAKLEADGLRPVVFLGPEEAGMREQVRAIFPGGTPLIDGLSIPQFIAAAARLEAFVTNDTGPMHLAACAGAPILLLMDELAPITYLPLTDKIHIVRHQSIGGITAGDVHQAVRSLLIKFLPE